MDVKHAPFSIFPSAEASIGLVGKGLSFSSSFFFFFLLPTKQARLQIAVESCLGCGEEQERKRVKKGQVDKEYSPFFLSFVLTSSSIAHRPSSSSSSISATLLPPHVPFSPFV
jgi:hypothetical protein